MRQSAFTIVTEVEGRSTGSLSRLLDAIGANVGRDPTLGLAKLNGLHFASLCLVPVGSKTYLFFEGNIDGDREAFLRHLLEVSGPGVDQLYSHTVGYPALASNTNEAALAYLLAHDMGADAFFVAYPGQTVELVKKDQYLRDRVELLLGTLQPGDPPLATPAALHAWARQQVANDPGLAWALYPAPAPFLVRYGRKLLVGVVVAMLPPLYAVLRAATGRSSARQRRARTGLVAVAVALLGLAARLRAGELVDNYRDARRDPDWLTVYERWTTNLASIQYLEDVQDQNHMVSVTEVKAGIFRYGLLRLVLSVVNLAARLVANQGVLSGIGSIHFARWLVAPDRRHLVFLTNYDGSWENYLGDFIERAAVGLTAVWSNTNDLVGFPPTQWLIGGGARQEVRLKAFARTSMRPTSVFYSAYPAISVGNIRNNMGIRQGLSEKRLDGARAAAWVRRL